MLQEHTYVLDMVTMRWSKFYTKENLAVLSQLQGDADAQGKGAVALDFGVKRMNGIAMTPRSGHTIISMADNLTLSYPGEQGSSNNRGGSASAPRSTLSDSHVLQQPRSRSESGSGESKGAGEDADALPDVWTHCAGMPVDADVMMVIFGGYGRSARTCHNDVHVICARPNLSAQAHRERVLKKSAFGVGGPSEAIAPGAAYGTCYKYAWRNDLHVSATQVGPPAPRLAHSATLLHPPKEYDAWGLRSVMVVFGGVGTESIFNDVHCLDVSRFSKGGGDGAMGSAGGVGGARTMGATTGMSDNFEWVEVVGQGEHPPHRYGHTASAIDSSTIVVCGGISEQPLPLDTLYLLHLERVERVQVDYTRTVCHFIWSEVRSDGGVPPCPRSRHSALGIRVRTAGDRNEQAGDRNEQAFDILVFGGSTMMENRPLQPEDSTATPRNLHALSVGWRASERRWSFGWREMRTSFQKAPRCLSSNLVISPSTLGTDLASILSSGAGATGAGVRCKANIWFTPSDSVPNRFDDSSDDGSGGDGGGGGDGVETGVGAHKFMLAVRSDRFRAMMSSGMKESSVSRLPSTMPRDILVEFLHFLYSDNISQRALGDPNMMMRLLVVANEYTISRLARLCEGTILRMLVPENAAAFLEFADLYGLDVSDGSSGVVAAVGTGEGAEKTSESSASSKVGGGDGAGRDDGAEKNSGEEEGKAAEGDRQAAAGDEVVTRRQYGESVSEDERVQRSNSILREGCMSFVLRHYKEVEGTEEFQQLSESLKTEVERRRTEFVNVYSAEYVRESSLSGGKSEMCD
jgi:hypothetical protein